jgi:anti-anti-sigma factor
LVFDLWESAVMGLETVKWHGAAFSYSTWQRQDWSEDIILVDLPQEPEMGDELKTVTQMVRDRGDCEVVIDFSNVDILTSSSISKLLKLRKLLGDCGHRLVFCSVAAATRGIFTVTGLDGIFEFADDKFVALASLQMVS